MTDDDDDDDELPVPFPTYRVFCHLNKMLLATKHTADYNFVFQ